METYNDIDSLMGTFERYLSLWVASCILAGVALGNAFPGAFQIIASLEYAHVNLAVAVLIWVMIYPMMVQIDFSSIKDVGKNPKGLILTLVVNWLIKPFTMAALGWLFFKVLFAGIVDPQTATEYIAGMILLGVAPCTAMVFVWSQLTKGDPNYTLVQVSVNDVIMIFAFAPLAAFLLGVSNIDVPWETLLISVGLYVLLPLIAGAFTRHRMEINGDDNQVNAFVHRLKPWMVSSWPSGNGCPAVRISGRKNYSTTARHPAHRNTTVDSNLRHICNRIWSRQSDSSAPQYCCARLPDWDFEFFRARSRSRHIAVRAEFRGGASDSRWRVGGSPRDVVACCNRKSNYSLV